MQFPGGLSEYNQVWPYLAFGDHPEFDNIVGQNWIGILTIALVGGALVVF